MQNVIACMCGRSPLSDATIRQLMACVSRRDFGKRQLLVRVGVKGVFAYFIERGMTRSFWLVDGVEVTTSFSLEGSIVFSMDEMYYDRVSEEFVETIEPTEAYAIAVSDLRHLMDTNIELSRWARIIHQDEYRRIHRSHKERLTLPARGRYEAFRRQFPEVCRRANLGFIASYLGITLPTLSRLRGKAQDVNLSQDK